MIDCPTPQTDGIHCAVESHGGLVHTGGSEGEQVGIIVVCIHAQRVLDHTLHCKPLARPPQTEENMLQLAELAVETI